MKLSIKNSSANLSRNTLDNAVPRALQFLRAVGTDATIMDSLKQTGFDEAAQKQGWSLVLTAYSATSGPVAAGVNDTPLSEAIDKVVAWQSAMFLRAHAALHRFHEEQDAFVFANLETGDGIAAVPAVATFLDRLDALDSSPERKATRKADHAALDLIAQRGITKDERKQMGALVEWIESTAAAPLTTHTQSPRDAALTAVYEWVQDWTDCARTVITRRDQLIRLGIGKRRSRKADAQPTPQPQPAPQPPVVATPVVPPPPVVPPDAASTDPAMLQMARAPLALPPKSNGVTPGSIAVPAAG
ncbi:MAG TPA: hypothetical protein VGH28_30530 [Polyangiaceae bacterium]|jgi:hypothetical protein